ncbi:Short-chain dehydrogenase/reductase [Lachnellula hyalina]|uniref:Short-chain dehydrogenase/reductase n=1 Tax=Lachnellula hyalina TaxID=1316788 RepID=A0A8H8R3V0_9HELO|nr:Short-chain dehydrogenase/reductase [Lachnellula hyalina]TVY27556.1 Short-chain dehydrogenase/reductase [Lachnellula hyalina]
MPQQKYNKLAGKHVLVIGGTSGLGFAVAEAAIESNARVTVSSSSNSKIEASLASFKKSYPGATVAGYPCDLSKPTVEADLEALFKQVGQVDHIVVTAGDKLAVAPIQEVTYERIISAGQVRFVAPILIAKVGSKYLNKGPESSIVLSTGSVSQRPNPGWSVVASYAAGLHGLTRNLALDLKPIRVNLVSPGAVDTELWKDYPEEVKRGFFKEFSDKVPTGHVGKPEEVAECYLWLMKDTNATGVVADTSAGSLLV